jgi:uncharacterized protein (TIGR04255 family)
MRRYSSWYTFRCESRYEMSYTRDVPYPRREVFRNAPLEYVACEIRTPLTPRLTLDETFVAFVDAFAARLPVPHREHVQTFTVGETMTQDADVRFRFTNVQRTESVMISRTGVTVETTDYSEYPAFRALISTALTAVEERVAVVGVERIGLRFIDEIRVPTPVTTVGDWQGWIASEVLGPVTLLSGFDAAEFQTVVRLDRGDSHVLTRFAALSGAGVVSEGPMRRRSRHEPGPFFVIDLDSYRETPGPEMMRFVAYELVTIVDALHDPAGDLFHRCITDQLRDEFRRS